MDSVTITVRIPESMKKEIRKYKVNVSEVVRRALEEEIERRRLEELGAVAKDLAEFFSKIPTEEIVRGIREDREGG